MVPHTSQLPITSTLLSACTPDTLQEAILLCQPVHRVVALTHGAYESAEGICLVLAGIAAVLVDFADRNLNGGVVLGFDDAAGGAALAGDVALQSDQLRIFWRGYIVNQRVARR